MKQLLTLLLFLVIVMSSCKTRSSQHETSNSTNPNIIFILTDDQRDDSFSAMGHPWVKTPNVDKLLAQGTRFKNAYIAEPTCNPSRAALFLGCHERVNRIGFSSNHKLTNSQWEHSYPAMLKKAGYQTAFVGKWHASIDGNNFHHLFDYCKGHKGHGPFFFKVKDEKGNEKNITTNRNHTNNALEFIEQSSNDTPFCLSLCYATPHGSKVRLMHKPYDESASKNPLLKDHHIYGGMYRDLDIAYPLQNPENPYDHIPKEVMHQDSGRSRVYNFDYDEASNKEHHYRYYQMITEVDEMVGEIVAKLKDKNIEKETIIIFGSDHGVLLGEYGMGGKGLLYDLASQFPCFIYDPNAPDASKGQTREEIVSSLDITATILDYGGVEKAEFMYGSSLKSLIQKNERPDWRDGLYLENLSTGRDTPLPEGYVEDGWKYIRCYKALHPYTEQELLHENEKPVFEMLFDLKNDPKEMNNLASSPESAKILNELREKCEKEYQNLNQQREEYRLTYLSELQNKAHTKTENR